MKPAAPEMTYLTLFMNSMCYCDLEWDAHNSSQTALGASLLQNG